MKLAFSGQGRYADFTKGYDLYVKRSRSGAALDQRSYNRIVRRFCQKLSQQLSENGIVDLPAGLGSIAAAEFTRKPQYRGKRFVGYGKMDWTKGHYDGTLKAFGFAFLPVHGKNDNLRCYGFVANRRLFQKMKGLYEKEECAWTPIAFDDEMI